MKTTIKVAAFLIMATMGLVACRDHYKEFYSTGEWKLESYYYNGSDNTSIYLQSHENYTFVLKIGHSFIETYTVNDSPYTVNGTWDVSYDVTILRLYDAVNGTREYEITQSSTIKLFLKKGIEEWHLKRP